MNWVFLIIAGLFEVGFAYCLGKAQLTKGTDYYLWMLGFLLSLFLSMYLLYRATLSIPIGIAYPVWTGIGAVGTVLSSIFFLHQNITPLKIFFLSILIISIIGLKIVSK